MEKKKVLLIAHFCDYGQENSNNRFNYIAQLLYENGMDVELVTSSFSHRDKVQRVESDWRDYKTTLIYEPSYKKNVSLKRFFYSHYVMSRNLKKYLGNCEKPDVIYCAIPSLDVAYVAGRYAKKHGIKFILDIQDLWPEAFSMLLRVPIISNLVFLPLKFKADGIYGLADMIVGVSQTYVNRGLAVSGDRTGLCIYLGTDLQQFDEEGKAHCVEKKQEEIWVVYAGTLGHSYNIPLVIDALSKLKEQGRKNVQFKVLGDGPLLQKFKSYAEEKQVNVEFLGKKTYSEMVSYLCESDIAVNPITKGSAATIINKHGDYAAAGLPVVNTQDSPEYQELLETYQCGINCGVESVEDVAKALDNLIENRGLAEKMGLNSRALAEERFDRKYTYQQVVRFIMDTQC